MKKLFTMLVATVCATMAYAQTDAISLNDVTIAKGGTQQVEVAINNAASKTAFQFDLALPTGVTVKEAKLNGTYGTSRHLEKGTVDGKMRFLSYDDANALLADGAKVLVTLEAAAEAETATLTANGIVVVDPEAASVGDGQTASATITVSSDATIAIGSKLKTTYVGAQDLDFSGVDGLKAYIASGYDKDNNVIFLTKVTDVPAGTPIYLVGAESKSYTVPATTSTTYYPANFLKGNANAATPVDGSYLNLALKSGEFQPLTATEFVAGKAYLQLPATIASSAGEAFTFTMGKNGKKMYIGNSDLNFTDVDGLKAYTVTGYDKSGTIWLTRVMKASANTPLYLVGAANTVYSIPSSALQVSYVNMLKGDANNATNLTKTAGDYTNCIMKSGSFQPLESDDPAYPAGYSYLPIPTSFLVSASRGDFNESHFRGVEAETISISLNSIGGDGNTTGISRVAAEVGNDTWYNLNGQRIDTPTKKGLYIKNGKKVIVK